MARDGDVTHFLSVDESRNFFVESVICIGLAVLTMKDHLLLVLRKNTGAAENVHVLDKSAVDMGSA